MLQLPRLEYDDIKCTNWQFYVVIFWLKWLIAHHISLFVHNVQTSTWLKHFYAKKILVHEGGGEKRLRFQQWQNKVPTYRGWRWMSGFSWGPSSGCRRTQSVVVSPRIHAVSAIVMPHSGCSSVGVIQLIIGTGTVFTETYNKNSNWNMNTVQEPFNKLNKLRSRRSKFFQRVDFNIYFVF